MKFNVGDLVRIVGCLTFYQKLLGIDTSLVHKVTGIYDRIVGLDTLLREGSRTSI